MRRGGPPRAARRRNISPAVLQERVRACDGVGSEGVLRLDAIVRFRRRTRSNPVSFQDFLQSLRDTKGIRTVFCYPSMFLGIRQDEWHQIVCTFGQLENLSSLNFTFGYGGFIAISASALAETLERTSSIKKLVLSEAVVMVGPVEALQRLARAIAVSALTKFKCECLFRLSERNPNPRQVIAEQGVALCTTLECLSLRDHMRQLSEEQTASMVLRLTSLKLLSLYTCHWRGVGRAMVRNTTIRELKMTDHDVDPESFASFLTSLQRNQSLRGLTLALRQGFRGGTTKQALLDFIEHHESLERLSLIDTIDGMKPSPAECFSPSDVSALVNSVAANGLVQVDISGLGSHVHDDDCERHWRCREQVKVENILNRVGRRRLRRCLGDREQYQTALLSLAAGYDQMHGDDTELQRTQCFFDFFRMNPSLFDMP